MRVSEISQWLECETMALKSPKREGRTHVAAWVGTMAHALIAGLPAPEPETRLGFDHITPTAHVGHLQAEAIAEEARTLLEAHKWAVLDREEEVRDGETTGHLDILAYHEKLGYAIIDLKTGRLPSAAWVQVGGYISLSEWPVELGGVLHVPRMTLKRDQVGDLYLRQAKPLKDVWWYARKRIQDVMMGGRPAYRPGTHCTRCTFSDCPVRAM